jgi:putative DNA primase/helicase
MNAEYIAHLLGATRQGHNWRAPCPCGCGYGLSLADGEDGRVLAYCFGGCPFDQVMATLVGYGLLDDTSPSDDVYRPDSWLEQFRELRSKEGSAAAAQRIERARAIYASGVEDERIGVYLRSRGIHLTSPVLRFGEQAPHRLGARLPAMLAPVVDAAGEQIGVHITYLRPDGAGKANLPKEHQRESRGAIRGGAIRLLPFNPDVELVIAEGIETALAAAEIFVRPAWSAVYAGGLKTVELPLEARRVFIAADNDASGTGQRNALIAYDRWTAEGRAARLKCPPVVGEDFCDVLLKRPVDVQH